MLLMWTPVVAHGVVVCAVVARAGSGQRSVQQVSVESRRDRQHPAAVTPHVHIHVRHVREIQLKQTHTDDLTITWHTNAWEHAENLTLFIGN